ncbi:ankyrin-3-like protein [Favolaschia claudopus]|uniref:Ankyrin-3-like protein n=1 Tax=Favolaschia claudopus TaxID=2862362 RepID=A0AAW0EGN2_9AGAR
MLIRRHSLATMRLSGESTTLHNLPLELIQLILSFLSRRTIVQQCYGRAIRVVLEEPDLPSMNAMCQTSVALYNAVNWTLYRGCASNCVLSEQALAFAIQHQSENTIHQLVSAGASLSSIVDFEYRSCGLLHAAAQQGYTPMVAKLLEMYQASHGEAKTMAWVHNPDRGTALTYAARHGQIDVAKLLAPIPPSPHSSDRQPYLNTALMEAAKAANAEISGYLIAEGADVNFLESYFKRTPLYYAADRNNLELCQLLLASGANPDLGNALARAVYARHLDIVRALVEGGANVHILDVDQRSVLFSCTSIEILLFFLECAVDPNTEDSTGGTILHYFCGIWNANKAFVELLLQFGAGPLCKVDHKGRTAVDIAVSAGFPKIVEVLESHAQDAILRSRIGLSRHEKGD